jgi:hypothetical protein
MSLSYREKSTLGSLAAILVGYGYYFRAVLRSPRPAEFTGGTLRLLLSAVFIIVVIEVVYQIMVAVTSKVDPKDERDILIGARAYRNAYAILVGAVFCLMGVIVFFGMTPYLIVNFALLSVVMADVVKFLTQLFYYQWGI